jgi:hypothetical protein
VDFMQRCRKLTMKSIACFGASIEDPWRTGVEQAGILTLTRPWNHAA